MTSSLLRSLWNRVRNPTYLVGRDLEGNKYFEYPNPHGDFGRPKRVVKYRRGSDMWTYVAGDRRLAVQWSSWLTHTRSHPPTLEELHADVARQQRVKMRAALIEAGDQEALQVVTPPSTIMTNQSNSSGTKSDDQSLVAPAVKDKDQLTQDHESSESESKQATGIKAQVTPGQRESQGSYGTFGKDVDETQAWAPRVGRRGH